MPSLPNLLSQSLNILVKQLILPLLIPSPVYLLFPVVEVVVVYVVVVVVIIVAHWP